MLIPIITFVAVVAIVFGAYWFVVGQPETTEQEKLRRRLKAEDPLRLQKQVRQARPLGLVPLPPHEPLELSFEGMLAEVARFLSHGDERRRGERECEFRLLHRCAQRRHGVVDGRVEPGLPLAVLGVHHELEQLFELSLPAAQFSRSNVLQRHVSGWLAVQTGTRVVGEEDLLASERGRGCGE